MHIKALYLHDDRDRISSVNQWNNGIAPRFFLGRTDTGNAWRFRADLPDEVCEELENFCRDEPFNDSEPPKHKDEYLRILSEHSPIKQVWNGPAYWFAKESASTPGTIAITEMNASLLQGGLEDWLPEVPYQKPFMAVIKNGQAVSVCASVRITDAAHEAGVETLQSHRCKGYAVNVVSAWAHAVGKMGAKPLYSTSNENLPSLKVAARLNLSKYGVDFHIT